jgi:nitric oxide reductase activation protein
LGLGFRRHFRQRDGEELDAAALVEFAVGRRTGEDQDERIYETKLRTARDLGVLVLLDASGSTAEKRGEGDDVWKEQRQVTTNLVAALEHVGDRVAAYGFFSHGRQRVQFLRIKEFDGRFDHAARRRLGALEPTGYTRIGAAVRHGTHLLATKADASNLLLVVVSDGFPYDGDYQSTYAEADTRRALHEAVNRGVGCVCLSVGGSTDQATLGRVWGNVTHGHINTADELGRFAVPLFRAALKAAAPARMSVYGGQARNQSAH